MSRPAVQRALQEMDHGPVLAGETCARCDTPMVITRDAIGRPRKRCPKCDGVSRVRVHPDEVMLPQGLVRVHQLPPVRAGQLRCQGCGRGVVGSARFCAACEHDHRAAAQRQRAPAQFAPKPCKRCTVLFAPAGPNSQYCEACK